jgi:hypothetical protein
MNTLLKKLIDRLLHPEQPLTRVMVFGAAGGGLGVIAGLVLGELTNKWYVLFVPNMLLGAGAAIASVFVLLGIKTEDVHRCCGVALLAGFFWQPVLAAGKEYLLNAPEREAEAQAAQTAEELDQKLSRLEASPTNNVVLIQSIGALTENLTRETPELRRSPTKVRAQTSVDRAVRVLGQKAENKQPAAMVAVTSVAETAVNSGNQTVALKAAKELARVPVTTNQLFEARKKELMLRVPRFE